MAQDRFLIANILLQARRALWIERNVEENILPIAMLANNISHSALAPNVHFIHVASRFRNPAFDAVHDTIERRFVQVGLNHAHQFVFIHEGCLLSMGLLKFTPWASQERKGTYKTYLVNQLDSTLSY